jgi:hypothetical protein
LLTIPRACAHVTTTASDHATITASDQATTTASEQATPTAEMQVTASNTEKKKVTDPLGLHVTARAVDTAYHIYFERRYGGRLVIKQITYFKKTRQMNLLNEVTPWIRPGLGLVTPPVRPTTTAFTPFIATVVVVSLVHVSSSEQYTVETSHKLSIKLRLISRQELGGVSLDVHCLRTHKSADDPDIVTQVALSTLTLVKQGCAIYPSMSLMQTVMR